MTDLQRHWLRALDASAAAVEAASRAHLMAPEAARRSSGRLAAEHAWVDVVDWSTLEPAQSGSILTIEPLEAVPRRSLVKAA
jgi:hypothetical protein